MSRENLVGQSLSGYRIRSLVGEGGTSAVYQADHSEHGLVALKVLREKLRQDQTAVKRFVREASYGERVTHPNVVRTIQVGEDGEGRHFLAIEWASGEILDRYIRRASPVPPVEAAEIVLQIADAVHAAHVAGIVHRDLKPENVMYDPEARRVKLLDFGIAMDTDISSDERLTRAGFFVGTLTYVAPEALSGAVVTPAADQYSLATIAYNLLTGALPFTARTPREMFSQLLQQQPIPLNKARAGLEFPEAVEAVVMRALSKDPAQRYSDVLTFARELRNVLNAPPPPRPEGFVDRLKKLLGG